MSEFEFPRMFKTRAKIYFVVLKKFNYINIFELNTNTKISQMVSQ